MREKELVVGSRTLFDIEMMCEVPIQNLPEIFKNFVESHREAIDKGNKLFLRVEYPEEYDCATDVYLYEYRLETDQEYNFRIRQEMFAKSSAQFQIDQKEYVEYLRLKEKFESRGIVVANS